MGALGSGMTNQSVCLLMVIVMTLLSQINRPKGFDKCFGTIRLHSAIMNQSSLILSLGKSRCFTLYPREMFEQDPIEWPEEVEIRIDRLESESAGRALTRAERALMDVYETVQILEIQDGLHEFWQSGVDHQRIINSFDLIGAATLVDSLNASRWCETRSADRNDYTETESDYLATIEEELPAALDELVDLVMDFIEEELE